MPTPPSFNAARLPTPPSLNGAKPPTPPSPNGAKPADPHASGQDFQLLYFSNLLKIPVCAGKVTDRIGRATDLVFRLAEPYPEAVGIYVEHGGGRPDEFIPWERVVKIADDALFITRHENGQPYPPFADQPGWILINEHLMGRTIYDLDGRRTEVVNDVHLLASRGRMLIVHVDISFNGFLRKWGLGRFSWTKDQLISWRYVQPLSLEDVGAKDAVSLSITRQQIRDLPGEDLADALEELSGKEQTAVFLALDSEKAAEVLSEAEPRAQRQLVANLRRERASSILSEMSVPQLAALFSVLPHADMTTLMGLLPPAEAERIATILSQHESTARTLMSGEFLTAAKETTVGALLADIRTGKHDHDGISYIYVVGPERVFLGVVDLRDLVLANDHMTLGELMVAPVVSAQEDDVQEDLAEVFAKYHFRMIPVVDAQDRILGVIRYKDIMKGLVTRAKA
jgi:CBS domain-containing protein